MQYNIYLVGVGGQGVIRLGQIIAGYALKKVKRLNFIKKWGWLREVVLSIVKLG